MDKELTFRDGLRRIVSYCTSAELCSNCPFYDGQAETLDAMCKIVDADMPLAWDIDEICKAVEELRE